MDIRYELEHLDRNIRRLEGNVKLCRNQIEQIRMHQEKSGVLQAEESQKKTNGRDVHRKNSQPSL